MIGRRLLAPLVLAGVLTSCGAAVPFYAGDESLDAAFVPRQGRGVLRFLPAKRGLADPGEVSDRLRLSWSFQLGTWIPLPGGEQDYGGAPFVRAVCQLGADRGHPLGFELGTGLLYSASTEGPESWTWLVSLSARCLYVLEHGRYCLSGGGQLIYEDTVHGPMEIPGYLAGTIDLGASYRFGGRYEAGLSYMIFLGSRNVPGAFELSLGVAF